MPETAWLKTVGPRARGRATNPFWIFHWKLPDTKELGRQKSLRFIREEQKKTLLARVAA